MFPIPESGVAHHYGTGRCIPDRCALPQRLAFTTNVSHYPGRTGRFVRSGQRGTADAKLYIPLAELVDLDAERKRLSKELEKKKKYQGGIEKKLSNEKFLAKAPEDVVQREKDNLAKAQKEIEQLESSLAALG